MALRDFQAENKSHVYGAFSEGAIDVLDVMPTGSGKTTTFCDIVREWNQPACLISHRQELIGQAALALNREHVEHSIIAPKEVIRQIIALEHEQHGYSSFNSRAQVKCAGVDTIIRHDAKDRWYSQVGLVVTDEAHHNLRANKWGKARLMFPNARGLGMTAHAVRADGKGLGRDAAGIVDRLIVGPYGRQLINRGFLTDYRIICVGSDIDFSDVPIGPSGELNMPKLRAATHSSNKIVGDVVQTYLKFAAGKLGITFAVDIEEAKKLHTAFNAAGVAAEIITGDTPITVRGHLMRKFRARQILQLISVDCLGEGVDVPAIEVVSFARKTASWQLMCQQFGRSLRVMVDEEHEKNWNKYTDDERLAIIAASSKPKAIIIDHVGNIIWHAKMRGLPDTQQEYTLLTMTGGGRGKSDAIPMRACLFCYQPYECYLIACPHCGMVWTPGGRGTPELVEGDLIELDPRVLQAMQAERDRINGPVAFPPHADAAMKRGILRTHHDRYAAQESLQRHMALWGGWQRGRGIGQRESQKLFYIKYGIDVLSAQALGATPAQELEARIVVDFIKHNVTEAAA